MMSRAYNDRVSAKMNDSLDRREVVVRRQKRILGIGLILLISLGILLGTGIKTFASSKNRISSQYKYYTSILVEQGDTLWDIAGEYTLGTDIDKEEYIQEICELNHMNRDEIVSGEYIVVAYYSTEKK